MTNYEKMVAAKRKDPKLILEQILPWEMDVLHMGVIVGEACEMLEEVLSLPSPEVLGRSASFLKELGDYRFYRVGYWQALLGGLPELTMPEQVEIVDKDIAEKLLSLKDPHFTCMREVVLLSIVAGWLLDSAKRIAIYREAPNIPRILQCLTASDMVFASLIDKLGLTMEQIEEANIVKLDKRFAGGTYSDDGAQRRADTADQEA